MPAFIVAGPFDVPLQPGVRKAKLIDRAAAKSLAGQSDGFLRRGCYVFGIRAGKGARPIYVGMTKSQNLITEAFNEKNVNRVNEYQPPEGQPGRLHRLPEGRQRGPGEELHSCNRGVPRRPLRQAQSPADKCAYEQEASWSIAGVVNAEAASRQPLPPCSLT